MAGYQDWMNPNPQAAHTDRLLNDPRNPTILGPGSFQPTRERVDPRWQLPWQGNADFLTGVPNTDQREGFQYDIGIDGNTESFNFDEELTPQGMEAFRGRQGITSDPLRRENMMIPPPMRDRYPGELDPATGQMRLQQYLGREELIPQTQRPARPVVPFPEGESLNKTPIANSFIERIKNMFNRGSL